VRVLIRLALGMGWAMTAGGRLGNLIRRSLVPRLHRIPGVRARLVSSSTAPLRRSDLIVKSGWPGELAGTLCPNPIVSDGQRLDTLLGNGFGLITAEPMDPSRVEELRRRGATVITAAPGTALAKWLRGGRTLAAIVRPDRTVMQTGRRLLPLCDAIPRFPMAVGARRSAPSGAVENI
jgi:3-(3-hydroxy-phenyl)propionate hydroxylase